MMMMIIIIIFIKVIFSYRLIYTKKIYLSFRKNQ